MLSFIFNKIHFLHYRYFDIKSFYYKKLLLSCGYSFKLWGNCYIKNPNKIIIGNNVSINDNCYLNGLGEIQIGNNVSLSANSMLISTGLNIDTFKIKKEHINKKITIGNNVQVGAGAIILSGVTVNDNVIIGAGSVVIKDIESNCIVVGNPARVLRKI